MTAGIDFTTLEGTGLLDAVDFASTKLKEPWRDEDASVCRFRLDGKVYAAVEDPSDGYRSCLGELIQLPDDTKMENVFPPTKVVIKTAEHRKSDWGDNRHEADVLNFIDWHTGEIVLEVGTDHADDYYPSFVANFNPKYLAHNNGYAPDAVEPEEPAETYSDNPAFGVF